MVTYPIEYITIGGGYFYLVCMVERVLILWKTRGQNEREQQGEMRALRADTKRPPQCAGLYTKLH